MRGNPTAIENLAKKKGYRLEQRQEDIGLLIFTKGRVQINVYTSKMTVGTCLQHPKSGRTQLFRKYVDMPLLAKIFEEPRIHTQIGYFRKNDRSYC